MTQQEKELLFTLKNSAHGRVLKKYLELEKQKIADVLNCNSWDETIGRQHAVKLINNIFGFLEEKEAKERTPNQYT